MLDDIEAAVPVAEKLRSPFETLWNTHAEAPLPEYRILIWGSTIQEHRTPTDLDVIIEYTGTSISPEIENTIEHALHDAITNTAPFSYVDPLVTHYLETPDIVATSRNDRVYSVDENGWLTF